MCSRNRWRSPTAERLFDGASEIQARSAGTEPSARVRVNARLLGWADAVFCMERRHLQRLRERFPDAMMGKPTHVLDVPDDYAFMDPELVDVLRAALADHVPPPRG